MEIQKKLSAKEAVDKAKYYFYEITGFKEDIMIEEIEPIIITPDSILIQWKIIISYRKDNFYKGGIQYKDCFIDAVTGELSSLKINTKYQSKNYDCY